MGLYITTVMNLFRLTVVVVLGLDYYIAMANQSPSSTLTYLNYTVLGNWPANTKTILLNNNSILEMTNDSFRNTAKDCVFYQLEKLDLSFNKISNIECGALSCLTYLETLDMSFNNLTYLPANVFNNQRRLTTLNVSHNVIAYIANGTFTEVILPSLTHVYMHHNRLTTFEPWPYILPSVKLFDLKYNDISVFESPLSWSYDLRRSLNTIVDLRFNNISTWSYDFDVGFKQDEGIGMQYVTDLRHNPWICDCHLYNAVEFFQKSFFRYVEDNQLMLMQCAKPSELQGNRFMYSNLDLLVCNMTDDCPSSCLCQRKPAYNILAVNCSHGKLTQLPNALPSLEIGESYILDFSYNDIVTLDKRNYTQYIKELYLQGNRLQDISASFLKVSNLTFLDVRNNYISNVPKAIQLIRYEDIDLSGNQLICDCDMIWMAHWIALSSPSTKGRSLSCSFNDDHHKIIDISESLLNCTYDIMIGLAVTFGTLIIVAIIVAVWVRRCPYETKVQLFKFCGLHPRDKYMIDEDADTKHDVYISFDERNDHIRQWVLKKLVKKLEGQKPFYKLFIPVRDMKFGEDRCDEIMHHMNMSKRILIILSDGYEFDEWCLFECQKAEMLPLNEGRVIYVKYHYSVDKMLEEEPWKSLVKDRKVFSPGDTRSEKRWFWDKLRYELPVVTSKRRPQINYTV